MTDKMKNSKTSKEYLEKLVSDLRKEGEDKGELSIWVNLYDALSPEEQKALIDNLEQELKELQNLK